MKEKIDDLFRDNIDNRSFDYQDEFWGDIAAELDARDKKKKRPFFWVFAGLALPIFIAAGAYYFAPFGENGLAEVEATQLIFEDEKVVETKIEKRTISEKVNTELTNSKTIDKTEKEIIEKPDSKPETQASNTNDISIKKTDTNKVVFPKNTFANNDKIPTQIKSQKTIQVTDNQLVKNKENQELLTENIDNSRIGPLRPPDESGQALKGELLFGFAEKEKVAPGRVPPLEDGGGKLPKVIRTPIKTFPLIEKTTFFKKEKEENSEPNFQKQIIPISKKFNSFWTFGVVGTGGIDNQENQFSNWSAGVFADYRFAKKWSVDAAILYGEFTGDFGDTNSSLQTNYSFGRSREMQKLKTEKLSLLSLPVLLNFHQKRHQFGIGVQTDYVLAVHGQKEIFKEEKISFARVSSQAGIMSKPTSIPGLNLAGAAIYQHNFTHFSLGARGRYYFKNYLPTPDVAAKDLTMFDLILKVNLK